jgi:dihydrofolate synthase / folylpolyglutamate synthase
VINKQKGDHQLLNLGVVMATVDVLREEGWKLEYENVIQGLRSVTWPGRLQTINWKGREVNILSFLFFCFIFRLNDY